MAYVERFELPVLLDCSVTRLQQDADGFVVHTSRGPLRAQQVVVATGPFQTPVVPGISADLDRAVVQLHSSAYRNPSDVPAGPVLVVGGGNSGRQIALELAASHDVTLAVGTEPPQLPQRLLGRDLFWWLTRLGLMSRTSDSRLARRMRSKGDLVIGTPLSRLRRAGVRIGPRVVGASPDGVQLETGSTRPESVVWATGFRTDHSWIDIPGVTVGGAVVHERGVTDVPGLAFVGLPWQHTRGSALLGFVREDAAWIAHHVAERADRRVTV